jgi:hypothetical protein
VEAIRDSMLYVTGTLDERVGGPPQSLKSPDFKKRTIYARASRTPDGFLTLFDYPDPNITSEQRTVTNVPLQGLFFMNSDLVSRQADALAARLSQDGGSVEEKIQWAYRTVFQRRATQAEVQRGEQFLSQAGVLYQRAQAEPLPPREPIPSGRTRKRDDNEEDAAAPPVGAPATRMTPWQQYAQALLSAGEFYYIN